MKHTHAETNMHTYIQKLRNTPAQIHTLTLGPLLVGKNDKH